MCSTFITLNVTHVHLPSRLPSKPLHRRLPPTLSITYLAVLPISASGTATMLQFQANFDIKSTKPPTSMQSHTMPLLPNMVSCPIPHCQCAFTQATRNQLLMIYLAAMMHYMLRLHLIAISSLIDATLGTANKTKFCAPCGTEFGGTKQNSVCMTPTSPGLYHQAM